MHRSLRLEFVSLQDDERECFAVVTTTVFHTVNSNLPEPKYVFEQDELSAAVTRKSYI